MSSDAALVVDRETLHALVRSTGADVGVGTRVSRETIRDLARKIANATAAPGELTIKIVD